MPEINVKVIKKIYDWLEKSKYKINVIYGGAGAGKSYTVAQFLLLEKVLQEKNKRILVIRKVNRSLKESSIKLFKEILKELEIPYVEHKADQMFTFAGNTEIVFRGLDDPEKIKSAEYNYIWMEEATEFTFEDFNQLRLRLRRPTRTRNQMFLIFNPIGKTNWVYKTFFENEYKDTGILHVNYKDNVFLDEEYIEILKNLEREDERFYRIYTLGEFVEISNVIFNNYKIVDTLPHKYDIIVYGLDFGFNNPTACLKIGIYDNEIYIIDELYQTHLTNAELIERLKEFVLPMNAPIYADSSEPARIEEIYQAGFNIFPAKKEVKNGIDFLQRFKINISRKCVNTIKEIQNYKWKEDKNKNILDEPVKYMDHSMDAMRYAVYTHLMKPRTSIIVDKYQIKGVI